jgi:type II secretory pathway component GspD/PulD (secretin)
MKFKAFAVFLFSLILLAILSQPVAAQSVVQLPSFATTSVGTTVMVPDRGTAHLGSIARSSQGRIERGVPLLGSLPGVSPLFRNQATGRSNGKGTIQASVHIINLEELDQEVLAEAARLRNERAVRTNIGARLVDDPNQAAQRRKADFISRNVGKAGQKK